MSVNAINNLSKLSLTLLIIFRERQAIRRIWYKRLTRISFSTLLYENFGQMQEVIRERACRENETRTRDRGGRKSRGNARRETLGVEIHAYATISFDYIIVFRPGGIIHVNKLHIFFHSPSPRSFFCETGRATFRPIVAILPSSLIRDDCLIPCLVFPLRAEIHEVQAW